MHSISIDIFYLTIDSIVRTIPVFQSKAILFSLSPELSRINKKLRMQQDFELALERQTFPEGSFSYTVVTSLLIYVV